MMGLGKDTLYLALRREKVGWKRDNISTDGSPGDYICMKASARWRGSDRGQIAAAQFIDGGRLSRF